MPTVRLVAPMVARSAQEPHRAATPLELFFDLVFVVAVAQAGAGLHHAIAEGHPADGMLHYALAFFAIWWAWMNFTWFASAYDCDDVPYRLLVFVQMAGALILAAGIPRFFLAEPDLHVGVAGYVVMRLAMVAQWLRAARADPSHRVTAHRFALGITIVQVAWVARLWAPPGLGIPLVLVLVAAELLVPVWGERSGHTTWHPHHISERYGLMTIIVLGESILAAALATRAALEGGETLTGLLPLIIGGLLIVFSLWWLYFYIPVAGLLTSLRRAFVWGYGHYFVFAAAAAVGAGLAVQAEVATHHADISVRAADWAVAIPVAVYLACLWVLHYQRGHGGGPWLGPAIAVLILLTPLVGQTVLLTGLLLALLLGVKLVGVARRQGPVSTAVL